MTCVNSTFLWCPLVAPMAACGRGLGVALRKRVPHVCIRKAHSSFFAPLVFPTSQQMNGVNSTYLRNTQKTERDDVKQTMKIPQRFALATTHGVVAGESAAARAVIERPRRVRSGRRALCALSAPRTPRARAPPPPRRVASLTHERAGKFYNRNEGRYRPSANRARTQGAATPAQGHSPVSPSRSPSQSQPFVSLAEGYSERARTPFLCFEMPSKLRGLAHSVGRGDIEWHYEQPARAGTSPAPAQRRARRPLAARAGVGRPPVTVPKRFRHVIEKHQCPSCPRKDARATRVSFRKWHVSGLFTLRDPGQAPRPPRPAHPRCPPPPRPHQPGQRIRHSSARPPALAQDHAGKTRGTACVRKNR
ncbi:unnamed protein product [Spodoptera exigua]|nr:unnamed protein product [Spodoptera exigua]